MGGVPTKHHSHGKTARRRSHLALKKVPVMVCPKCKGPMRAHATCPNCGYYPKKTRSKAASNK